MNEISLLKGHKGSITCLSVNKINDNILASGSDDKSIRLWDLRINKVIKCFNNCFNSSIEGLLFNPKQDHLLYAIDNHSLHMFDIRKPDLIIKQSDNQIKLYNESINNELNCIDIHCKGNYIAIGDDCGSIHIISLNNNSLSKYKQLEYSDTLVGCVKFKDNSIRDLVSGNFDCSINSYDFNLNRLLKNYSYTAIINNISNNNEINPMKQLLVNPPFVQAVNYINNSQLIISGLGDGTLKLHKSKDLTIVNSIEAHSGMTTCLCTSSNIIYSGGVDKYIRKWLLNDNDLTLSNEYHHGNKLNAIVKTTNKVIAADTTNNITIYTNI